jgi:peptidoglycan/LPS O-acetylase OafA/YrhL
VLLFHFTSHHDIHRGYPVHVPWGHYGVELFFVISGFVILMTLERAGSIREFLISRIARLYPAYWCAVLLTSLMILALGRSEVPSVASVVANLTMFHTLLRFPPVDLSYWTLTVELVFYALMVLWFRFRNPRFERIEWYALLWLIIVGAVRLAWTVNYGQTRVPQAIALPLLVYYGQFFVVGICLYRIHSHAFDRLTLVTLGLACSMSLFGEIPEPGALRVTPPVYFLLTCAIAFGIWAALRHGPPLLRHPIMLFLGAISYPLYLIHQRVGKDLMDLAWDKHWPVWISTSLIAASLVLLAYLMHLLVETPGRALLRRKLRSLVNPLPQSISA